MQKNLPKRAASKSQFILWQCVAFMTVFIGTTMLMAGNGVGLILFLGGFGMSLREMSLRRKWKKQNGG